MVYIVLKRPVRTDITTMTNKMLGFMVCVILLVNMAQGFLATGSTADRLAAIEEELRKLRLDMGTVQECTSDFCTVHWSSWSTWGDWSHCSGQCSNGYGSREQTRTRTRHCIDIDEVTHQPLCTGNTTEVDTRPCNAVELYGCLNERNTNNTSGLYAVAYNFYDELAQSTCTAALTAPAHAAAVRRNCGSGHAPQCSTICSNLGYTCFDELHVYNPTTVLQPGSPSSTDEGKQGLTMYRYFGCSFGNLGTCGPNYCCCKY